MPLSVYAERKERATKRAKQVKRKRERVRSGVEEAKRVKRKSALAKRKLCGT